MLIFDGCDTCPFRRNATRQVKNLLRIALFQVAYIRNLFPSSYFQERKVFDDLCVKVLTPKNDVSRRVVDWMEKGVSEALFKSYLKCLRVSITNDESGQNLIEEYVFSFAYEADGAIRMQILDSINRAPVNPSTTDMKQLKAQVSKMTRLLVALMTSFDALPETKYVFFHLEYYEKRTPKAYEPPFFQPAANLPRFHAKPFSMCLGAAQTKDVIIGIK